MCRALLGREVIARRGIIMLTIRKVPAVTILQICGLLLFFSVAANAQTVIYQEDFTGPDGEPDSGGWVAKSFWDEKIPGPYFELGTFNDETVVWCGREDPTYVGGAGYGNLWEMWIEKEFSQPPAGGNPQRLVFSIQYDVEPEFDYVYVLVSYDDRENWVELGSFTWKTNGFEQYDLALAAGSTYPVWIRFMFESDAYASDETPDYGYLGGDGAFRLDYVQLYGDGIDPHHEDDFNGPELEWDKGKPIEPSFYTLEPYSYWADVAPDPSGAIGHAWVAYDPVDKKFPSQIQGQKDWDMGIVSPVFAIPADTETKLRFDVYRDLPLNEGLFYTWSVAAPPVEDGGSWQSRGFVYYGDYDAWLSRIEDITDLIEPGATQMQIRLGAHYLSYYNIYNGVFLGPGPIFGNVSVSAVVEYQVGDLAVRVFEDEDSGCSSPGEGLYGVTVNVFDEYAAAVGSYVTDTDGSFNLTELPAGEYLLSLVRPLGYSIESDDLLVTVVGGETALAEYPLSCQAASGDVRTIGYWKHQVNQALGGGGLGRGGKIPKNDPPPPDIESPVCDLLDLIVQHFNDNAINEVRIFEPAPDALCTDKLDHALSLLNLHGRQEMITRARQQLMALLLNTASGFIYPTEIVSEDGATLSQAITYCDNIIDDPDGDHELAKTIADEINNDRMVGSGLIPLDTVQIAYRQNVPAGQFILTSKPNPFNPSTTISFVLTEAASATLRIYDVSGHLVRTLLNGGLESQGLREVVWNGQNEAGRVVAAGVYFCKLDVGGYSEVQRMTLVK